MHWYFLCTFCAAFLYILLVYIREDFSFFLIAAAQSAENRTGDLPYHRVLTYIEYRAVSGVCRTIDPPPPLHQASVFSPRTKGGGGVHTRRAVGGGGSIFRKTPGIGLASYSKIPRRSHGRQACFMSVPITAVKDTWESRFNGDSYIGQPCLPPSQWQPLNCGNSACSVVDTVSCQKVLQNVPNSREKIGYLNGNAYWQAEAGLFHAKKTRCQKC